MTDPALSPVSPDPVAIALGWLIGEELARAKRVRADDLRAAARLLGLPEEDLPALETYLREAALLRCEDPEALPSVERAAVLVFFDARDIEPRPGSEPPWELVPLTERRRIGAKRGRLIRAIPAFNESTGASLRDNFEHPLLERLAGLVRARFRTQPDSASLDSGRPRSRTVSRDLDRAAPTVELDPRSGYEGLIVVATVAQRNHQEPGWARAAVGEIDARHPGLLTASEAEGAIRWLLRVGAASLRTYDWEPLTRRLLTALSDDVPASEQRASLDVKATPRSETVFRLIVAELVRQLGPEAVHVVAAGEYTNSTGSLEHLVEADLTKELRLALRRERKSSNRVAVSGVLDRPFVNLEGPASPATMLRPAYGVVPFDDSAGQLGRLVDWTNQAGPQSVVALLGSAGSGKTRLAVELCREMSQQGWRTGMLTRSTVIDPRPINALVQWNARRVLVADYAEDRPEQVRSILTRLHGAGSPTHPIRLVLTVRRPFGAGWRSAFRGSDGDDLLDTADELDVSDAWQHVDREHFFQSAQAAFATRLGLPTRRRRKPPAWTHDPTLDRPLLLAASALTDLMGQRGKAQPTLRDAQDVITALLSHEANYWTGSPAARNEPTGHALTERALIAAALGQPLQNLTEAQVAARLTYASDLAEETATVRRRWARWLLRLYPAGRLEPDLILEQLVIDQCARAAPHDPIDWVSALAPSRSAADLASTLSLITRVAQQSPRFGSTVTAAWSSALGPLLEVAQSNSDDGAELLAGLAAAAEALPVSLDIENIALDLPQDSRLNDLGRVLMRKTVAALQERGVHDDRMFTALLALGVYCGTRTEHDEAIGATTKALDWIRHTTTSNDAERRAELALSLGNLAGDLAESGEHDAAISAAQEAVDISRDLLKEQAPDAASELAAALQNLGAALTVAGDHHGAAAATTEALSLIGELAPTEQDPEQLSVALTNLALSLLHLGKANDAVEPAEKAVKLWLPLASKSSRSYDAQLLKALSTLGIAAARSHIEDTALESRREAVVVARQLYAQDPQHWRDDLTRHLRLLAHSLTSGGQTEEAAKTRIEAETVARARD